MAKKNVVQKPLMKIEPQTPAMEQMLQAGYPDMTVDKAKTIIAERAKNPALWPYEVMQKAEAFLAAYQGVPAEKQVISTRVGLTSAKED